MSCLFEIQTSNVVENVFLNFLKSDLCEEKRGIEEISLCSCIFSCQFSNIENVLLKPIMQKTVNFVPLV